MASLLGIDYGTKRIGLSAADDIGVAVPIPAILESNLKKQIEKIAAEAKQRRVEAIVIGMPYHMDGSIGKRAKEVEAFITKMKTLISVPIHTVDERLTSHMVEGDLKNMGRKWDKKSGEIDSRSATLILQDYIDQNTSFTLEEYPEGEFFDE